MGMILNTAGCDEHVPETERYIRTIKERESGICNSLPFEKYPHTVIVEMTKKCSILEELFTPQKGIHPTLSPQAIVTESHIDYYKQFKIQFGSYVQVHEQHNYLPRT